MRRRVKLDYWQEDSGYWRGQIIVIVPGVPDWKASAGDFSTDMDFLAWAQDQFKMATEHLPNV